MRKISISLIIFVFIILTFINISNADMGAPMVDPFDVTVSNENGAKYYETIWDDETSKINWEEAGTLDYGTKITVTYETTANGEKSYYYFVLDDGEDYYIATDDADVIIKNVEDDTYDESTKDEFLVVAKDGLNMYKGPGYNYQSLDTTIPFNTIVTGYYKQLYTELPWVYCSYNGVNGWIDELGGGLAHKEDKYCDSIMMYQDTTLYQDSNHTTSVTTIPSGTIIYKDGNDSCFWGLDQWSWGFYIKYNEYEGFLSTYDVAQHLNQTEYTINYDGAKMYENPNDDSNIIQDIPNGTTFKPLFEQDIRAYGWFYAEYNGKKGWIFYSEDINLYGLNYEEELEAQVQEENTNSESTEIIENVEEISDEENEIEEVIEDSTKIQNSVTQDNKKSSELTKATTMNVCLSIIIAALVVVIIVFVNKNNKLVKAYNEKNQTQKNNQNTNQNNNK